VQLQVLENKESNMIDAHNKDSHAQSMCDYQTIYLYKIACPQFIFNLASNLYYQTYDQSKGNDFFWGWGEQIFIIDKWLPHLEILGVKKMTRQELFHTYSELASQPSKRKIEL